MKKTDAINLLDYNCYREFLRDYGELRKQSNENFSLGSWAKSLGLGSTSSLTRVINGLRIPGQEISDKLIEYFGFNEREKEYFQSLIFLSKNSHNSPMSDFIKSRIDSLKSEKEVAYFDVEIYDIISHWYYVVIREMTSLKDFKEDSKWIKEKLRLDLSEDEIKDIIDRLVKYDLLRRNAEGKLEHTKKALTVPSTPGAEIISENFIKESLQYSINVLDNTKKSERSLTTGYFSIRESDFPKIRDFIMEMNAKIGDNFSSFDNADSIVQFQVLLFPVTKN